MLNQFELIKIFCAAAESRSFRQAAALLGKSPQSITRAIKELEALRGEILFTGVHEASGSPVREKLWHEKLEC
jgi:hypothetical protein